MTISGKNISGRILKRKKKVTAEYMESLKKLKKKNSAGKQIKSLLS